jgi:hypothetical protein
MNKAKRGAQALEPFTYYPIAFLAPLVGRDDLPDLIDAAVGSLEAVAERLEDDGPAGCVCCDRDITARRDIAGIVTVEMGEDEDDLAGPVCAVCAAGPMSILPKAAVTFRHIMRAAANAVVARPKGPQQ